MACPITYGSHKKLRNTQLKAVKHNKSILSKSTFDAKHQMMHSLCYQYKFSLYYTNSTVDMLSISDAIICCCPEM